MLDKQKRIREFVELRTLGYTYDEIVKQINISKPTLISWGKIYEKQIKTTELMAAAELGQKIVLKNHKFIEALIETTYKIVTSEVKDDKSNNRILKRASKKLYKMLKKKMKSIELNCTSTGKIISTKINWIE